MNYVKVPHTAIFSGPTACGKTQRVLDLIEKEYRYHFDTIIIICSTIRWNKTYRERSWIWKDDDIVCIEPKDKLFQWIYYLSQSLVNKTTLFIIDDIISDESLDKRRQSLLDLAISGRHRQHSLWLVTQSYTAIPKNLRRQKKQLFVWYPHEKSDLKLIDDETNIIPYDKLEKIKEHLNSSEHACLYIRLQYPRGCIILT